MSEPIIIKNCTIKNNTSLNSLINLHNAVLRIYDSEFIENQNPTIFIIDSNFLGIGIKMKKNYCVNLDYGCSFYGINSNFQINKLNLSANGIMGSFIGHIYLFESIFWLNDSIFSNLTNYKWGVCIFSKNSTILLNSNHFENFSQNCLYGEEHTIILINQTIFTNYITQEFSTIICKFCELLTLQNLKFSRSFVNSFGGALNIQFTKKVDIIRSSFFNNTALEAGGIYIYDSNVYISDCVFVKNTALIGSGGGIYFENKKGRLFAYNITSTNFTGNKAKKEGGGIKFTDIIPNIDSTLFDNNYADYGPDIASYPIRIQFKVYANSKSIVFI